MAVPSVAEKWSGTVNAVTIGNTSEQGGTRSKSITIGGSSTLPGAGYDGSHPNKPVCALEINNMPGGGWPKQVLEPWGDCVNDTVAWAKKAEEFGADAIFLRLSAAHPDDGAKDADACAADVKAVLEASSLPLIIWGCGDAETDNKVMPVCCQAAGGENCLIGTATEKNFRTLAASCLADNHAIIAESPLDINIAKQVNILLSDAGFPLERIVMFPTTTALGYGSEYVYSIMERGRSAGLSGDKLLAQPTICLVGTEAWRAKESKAGEDEKPEWGPQAVRGPLWEATTAGNLLQAGGELFVIRHPEALKIFKGHIERIWPKG